MNKFASRFRYMMFMEIAIVAALCIILIIDPAKTPYSIAVASVLALLIVVFGVVALRRRWLKLLIDFYGICDLCD